MVHTYHDPLVALHEITIGLLAEDNPDALLQSILDHAMGNIGADSGSIALLDKNRQFLEIRAFRGLEQDVPEKVKLKLGEGVTGRCILTGKTRNVGDTSIDPHYVEVRSDICSELAVPLKLGTKSFGVISVDSSRLNAFTDDHSEFLELLASYAAQIFANQQSLGNLTHRTHILEILLEVGACIGKYPRLKDVFNDIIELLEAKIGLANAAIYLLDEVAGELYIVASSHYSAAEKERGRYKPNEGITGTVYSSRKPIVIPDISENENFLNKTGRSASPEKTSFFASPILLDDEVRGVFTMEIPYTSESFFEDYTYLVQILSSLFSQAMQIQTLIEQTSKDVKYENIVLKRQLQARYAFDKIVGSSPKMKELFRKMRMAADSSSSVLLIGESGTGKELIASALHQNSLRREHKIVKINCAAIPADLLESELFGYAKGAFTGAGDDKKGKFLLAHMGTLFLDEIAEMDLKLQAKLLRFLQEREFSPLGSNKVFKVDTRIVAASNADLEHLVRDKKFREDLFYRLNVIRFDIPPLRDRIEDLPLLVQHLIGKISKATGKTVEGLTPEAFEHLERYSFPGNIRELENTIERAIVLSANPVLTADDLPPFAARPVVKPSAAKVPNETPAETAEPFDVKAWIRDQVDGAEVGEYRDAVLSVVEKELVRMVLQRNLFNKSKTAKALGINRLTLDRKIQEYNLIAELTS